MKLMTRESRKGLAGSADVPHRLLLQGNPITTDYTGRRHVGMDWRAGVNRKISHDTREFIARSWKRLRSNA